MLVAIALNAGHRGDAKSRPRAASTEPVAVSAVASNPATVEPCAQVLSKLPVQLEGLSPRIVHAEQSVAWGDPAVVLRCGVDRPANLAAGSTDPTLLVDAVNWLVTGGTTATKYTVIDRSVYIEVSVPSTSAQPPLGPLSDAVAKALPTAVCYIDSPPAGRPDLPLCTRRP